MLKNKFRRSTLFSRKYCLILIKKRWIMKSFFFALIFLFIMSYLSHLFVSYQTNPIDLNTIITNNKISDIGICECRCCLLTSTICESTKRHSISFKTNFSCDLCTNDFCMKNINGTIQCYWMYSMKSECFQYEHDEDSSSLFINKRLIL